MISGLPHHPGNLPAVVDAEWPTWKAAVRATLPALALVAICLLGLPFHYLWFHTLAELCAIVIAITALTVATASRHFTRNHFVSYIAVALGWCAAIDVMHMLTFRGMGLLPTDDANPTTQLWIAARALQALAMVTAPLFLRRTLDYVVLHAGFGAATMVLLLAIATGHFPDAFVEGRGLTAFKIGSEYVIIALLAASLVLLWRSRMLMSPVLRLTLMVSAALMIVSEFLFTQYLSHYATAHLFGHVLRIFAYWYLFVSLVQESLRRPFTLLARAASTYDAVPDPTLIVAADGAILQANLAAAHKVGEPAEALVGRSSHALFHDAAVPQEECPVCRRLRQGREAFTMELERASGSTVAECTLAPFSVVGPAAFVQVIRDITERKRHEAAIALTVRRTEALLKLPQAAEHMSEMEFMQFGQEIAEELTGSRIAFIHLVNDDEQTIELVAWSRRTLDAYCKAAFERHYPVQDAGIWADALRQRAAVIVNDYATAPGKRGLPEGHSELLRLVSVPVMEGGKVRMLTGVGNKPTDYTDADVETVQLLSDAIWRIASTRRSLQKLRYSEATLRTLVDAIPDVVYLKDARGAVLLCNTAFERLFGVKQAAILGKTAHQLVDKDLADEFHRQDLIAMAAGKPSMNEEWVTSAADGRRLMFETIKTPVHTAEGELLGLLGVSRDITIRKQSEIELKGLVHDLRERTKEMKCLIELSRVFDDPAMDEAAVLSNTATLLPPAFRFPDRIGVSIRSTWGNIGETSRARAGPALERVVRVGGGQVGTINVYFKDAAPIEGEPFLPEESRLLDTVALLIGKALERQHANTRVRRLSFLYDMLSANNRNLVHAGSVEELLAGLFRALSQHGEFPMVWIALTNAGELPLRLVHSFGIDAEQLPALSAILADPNPAFARAYDEARLGKVVAVSVPVEPQPGTWVGYLQASGIRSRAMLPLLSDGRLYGAVGVFSRGSVGFDEEQIHLLEEMAADLAYALTKLREEERTRAAEERAKASELRFGEVFDASPLPMQIMSVRTGRMLAANRALLAWLGYSFEDIATTDAWFDHVYADPVFREQIRKTWQGQVEAASTARSFARSPELLLRAKDGSERSAVGTMTILGDDAIVAWEDLTAIRRSESALRDSERRFRGLIEQTITGIYVSREGKIAYANPRFCEIIGWGPDELTGRDILDFAVTDPPSRERMLAGRAALQAGERSVSFTMLATRKDGSPIELGLHATKATWDGVPSLIVMLQDITERARAERQIADYVLQLEGSMRATLQAISNMVELRDPYTAGHERRVGLIARAIAREMGWDEKRCEALELTALVHDIGKIAVPAEILAKPTRLTPLEMELVRAHAEAGYEILKDVQFAIPVAEIIRQHHERLDGSGYPRGLKGEAILPEARIIAVADVVEAMSSHRPYRAAIGLPIAIAEIERGRGAAYDPTVVDALLRMIRDKGYQLPE